MEYEGEGIDNYQLSIVNCLTRPICEGMGISWNGQRERIRRDPILSELVVSASVTRSESKRGGRDMLCLPLKYLPGWLFGINANRVKPELRDKIIRYQRECYDVLSDAFRDGRLTLDPDFGDLLKLDTPFDGMV